MEHWGESRRPEHQRSIQRVCRAARAGAAAFELHDRACFWEPDVTRLAAMGAARSWMLLGTRHYQVGSDRGNSIVDDSRNPTLPG